MKQNLSASLRLLVAHRLGGPVVVFSGALAGYVVLGLCGYAMTGAADGVAVFWPATGLIVGLLVVAPSRLRLWIAAALVPGEFITDVVHQGYPVLTGLGWGATGTVEAALAAWIVLTLAGRRPRGTNIRDFVAVGVAAITAPLLMGWAGSAISIATFGGALPATWLSWSAGDGTGIILVVPLVIALANRSPQLVSTRPLMKIVEGGFVIAATAALFAFTKQPLELLVLPPMALLAVRNGLRTTAAASLSIAIVATVLTGTGHGPLSTFSAGDSHAIQLQVFITATAFVAFLICAAMSERDRAETALEHLATCDPLTDIPNRRKLMTDLEHALSHATVADPQRLVMFDLDGFKTYNDTFGHPEGDLLLRRLAGRFAAAIDGHGVGYRLGGDEFCALIPTPDAAVEDVIRGCCEALAEKGEGFTIRASFGTTSIPVEAATASAALHLADQRMYADKGSGRLSARQQSLNIACRILALQQPSLGTHSSDVATLARAVGERLRLDEQMLDEIERTAEVHDVGKIAIPHSILTKDGPLDDEEWTFMRRHTLVGENMLQAAPALASIATLVRSCHERFDGAGYPDGLRGDEIPLASRIVFICDAFEAITSDRRYRRHSDEATAMEELRRNAGTQFDPAIVDAFCDVIQARAARVPQGDALLAAA